MTFRAAPLASGFVAVAVGVVVIALFAPLDYYVAYAQMTTGGLAVVAGLYLILVVSWREMGDTDPRSPKLYSLIRREVRGRALRSVASGAAIAVLVGVLLSTMFLTNGAAYSISSTKDKLGADLLVVPRQTTLSAQPFYTLAYAGGASATTGTPSLAIPPYLNGSVTQQVAATPGVKQATPQLLVSYFLPAGGCGGLDVVYIVGTEATGNFVLESWLPKNVTQSLAGNGAIAGAEIPAFYQMPGQGKFYGVQLERQATLPRTGTFMDHVVFISMDTANRMLQWERAHFFTQTGSHTHSDGSLVLGFTEGQVSAIFVKLDDGVGPTQQAAVVGSRIEGVRAYTLDSIAQAAAVQYSGLLSIFSLSGGLVWAGSLALVATVSSLATNERRGEIGVIRTLGGSQGFIRRMIAAQSMLTSSVAGLIGILAVWIAFSSPVVYDAIMLAFKMPYVPPPLIQTGFYVAIAVAIVIVTSGTGALLAARISGRMDAYEAIRKGAR